PAVALILVLLFLLSGLPFAWVDERLRRSARHCRLSGRPTAEGDASQRHKRNAQTVDHRCSPHYLSLWKQTVVNGSADRSADGGRSTPTELKARQAAERARAIAHRIAAHASQSGHQASCRSRPR